MMPPVPSRWLVASSAACAVASATCAIAVGAPLFEPARPHPRAPVVTAAPAPRAVVQVPVVVTAPSPPRHCEVHVDLRFSYNDKAPPADIATELAPVLEAARAHPDAPVLVDGHADASGDAYQNLLLSKARSHNVAVTLAAAGIPNRVVERAFGEFAPTEAPGLADQRRVHVSIRDPQCHEEPQP